MPTSQVEARHVSKKYIVHKSGTDVTALEDVSLEVQAGEFCCIVGPSGCGKTTLLRIIAGLETLTEGQLSLQHRDQGRPLNALVFQEQSLFPWMSVQKNVEYGLASTGVGARDRTDEAHYWLEKMNLTAFSQAYPHQLSGGMKQRVSLARSLALRPELLLMDEPFAAVDEQTRVNLQNELLRLWTDTPTTVVFITHSIDEAVALGDRVVVMSARPATFRQEFTVNLPRPRDVVQLKANPAFGSLVADVWDVLRDATNDVNREAS